ncbi:MAG: CBS domain-containing protein [Candidatus Woesearchaeota archaeon]
MPFEISEIKHVRRKLGLTQAQLAKLAGVSQSLIAKTEAGTLDPAYSNAKKLFNALESFTKEGEARAGDLMTPKLVSVRPSDSVKEAIRKMKRHEISQMPVIEDGNAAGMISESILLDALMEGKNETISSVMVDAPPMISKDTRLSVVSELLRHFPLVLAGDKGKAKGIITKSDILRKAYNK